MKNCPYCNGTGMMIEDNRSSIQNPDFAAMKIREAIGERTNQENFVVLFLDTKFKVIASEVVFIGTLDAAVIHPREVFKMAVGYNAHAIILGHNHPSGDPTPSQSDIDSTKQFILAGHLMGIQVQDHIIVGDGWYSFRENQPEHMFYKGKYFMNMFED